MNVHLPDILDVAEQIRADLIERGYPLNAVADAVFALGAAMKVDAYGPRQASRELYMMALMAAEQANAQEKEPRH